MKKRHAEDSLDEACPLKRVRLTPWQQHLKNFGQSEGIEPVTFANVYNHALIHNLSQVS